VKLDVESATDTDNTQSGSSTIIISEALAKFLGLEGREMLKSEAIRLVWEYVKANNLEVGIHFSLSLIKDDLLGF
jgi:upstream activation factor subunit UAF30